MNNKITVIPEGGVTSALGFKAGGIHAGFRKNPERLDMALVEADELCPAAGVFTQNIFCAAPVTISREHLDGIGYGYARAMLINSGTANAATGSLGLENARRMAGIAADTIACSAEDVLVASTGVIGTHLSMEPFEYGVPALHAKLGKNGHDAACAIMTTDTVPKEAAVNYVSEDPQFAGITFTVGGMSKGSGMIMPNMATMIACITTDAPIAPADLHACLRVAADKSFNKVTVDGDTSTNDTCVAFASGKAVAAAKSTAGDVAADAPAQQAYFEQGSLALEEFSAALDAVCQNLARQMARDGEGATKLVTVNVTGAATAKEADMAARTVANSPLVKTAIAGHDANWGRIAGALGRSGAYFEQEKVNIDIMGMPVLRQGLPVPFDEDEALRRFEEDEIVLDCHLGAGKFETTMWTCDFTHEYISINGDYRS